MNLHIFNFLPIPRCAQGTPLVGLVVNLSGRLAAVDVHYRNWAAELSVAEGTAKEEPVKSDLIAELGPLVALLYALTEDQRRHVFATFHRGRDCQDRLHAVLEHYANWKEAA